MAEGFIIIYTLITALGLFMLITTLVSLSMDGFTPFGYVRSARTWWVIGLITVALIIIGSWGMVTTQPYHEAELKIRELEQ